MGSYPCLFPCLNGGQCVPPETCDCSLYQATGTRCQTVPNAGFEREMTCRAWGQYNFETFDGLYYFYPGKCTYTLLRDCEDTTQSNVIIQVHNDPGCRSSPYTCTRSISLFLPWEGEIRLHRTNVTFKGQRLQLPYHIHDIELEYISHYVLVTQQQGFTLAWDGHSGSVYIKLSPEYVGRTCGMCGNFNADVQDDLKTSYDVLTQDLAMFGNSWVEEEPHQAKCAPVPSMFLSPCASQDAHTMLKVEEVCAMLLEEPFKTCHEFVSPMSYMSSCSNDLCQSGPNGDVVCQVFTEYARACAHADHPLHHWRAHIPQCAVQCSPELQYKECITCCPVSCNMDRMCIDSKLPCLDGCYCPDDLIYEDGSCVKPSDCPCEYHGMVYPSGQTVQEECNNCTCMGGVWNCTDHSCPGECSVTGDMYFQSFDGRTYSFPASCQYVLAKSRNSGKFTVTIQNAPCGPNLDGACIQSVSLVIDEDPRTEITMSHLGEVFMAGQYRISLPYSDDVFHIQELSSMFLQVRTSPGLRLQYGWREFRLYLQVDELWKEDTVGLCGTFNGNIQDDFLSPSGMIESTPLLFGNAWRVSSACAPIHSLPQLDPCDTHQQTASYATEMCDVLNQELFATCHEYLSPIPFHRQCRADTCKCGAPCLCSALAHYARHCRKYHIIVRFRVHVPDCAIQCPETMEYGTCVSSCQRRCSALAVPQHCGQECEEGCVCPEGTFYSTRTHTCVPRRECPCSFLGADYAPGDVIMTSAGVQVCQDGKLILQSSESDKLCPVDQMYLDCSEGMDRGLACEQTCESFLLNLTCSTHEPCVPGCVCPPGMLKHGDECFEPDACPCLWKGKEYYPGDRVISPCYQCICQHGAFQCVFRPCPSMCTAYGDRHYKTFDGLLFDYVGACKVYLVKSTAEVMLSVSAENVDCFDSGIICRKSLVINIGRSFIAFDNESGKPNPSSVIDRKQSVFIWHAGYFTMVHVPEEDLTVLWDRKTTVHIQAGPRWQGKLSGLCGNFDLKTVNEMRTPENIDSPTAQEFGNSWKAAECVNSPDIRHPCSLSPLREPFAKRQCGVLLSEVFQLCHPVVDVTWFYMNCLSDTCGCSRGGDCECFCTSVAAYAHRCCHQGITIDWRSPSMCPFDCEFYNKVLGKGPYMLLTYLERNTVLAANRSSGMVFPKKLASMGPGILSVFMVTPGLSRSRPHDTSLVSLEVSERPNYFLHVDQDGRLRVTKWEDSEAFWDQATFVLHGDTWITGYDSLESFTKTGFFLHYMLSWVHLMKYKHTDSFRKATLFKLTGPAPDIPTGPRCQWRYDSCVSPCFKTCSDPSGGACVTIPKVEGCLPMCPAHMVLDEVTQRCVHVEDCIKPPVAVPPITTTAASVETPPAAVIPITATTTPASPSLSTEHYTPSPTPGPLTTASTPILTTSGMALSTAATTTVRFTTATSAVYTQTTTVSVPTTVPEKVVLPDSTSSIPAPVSHISAVASLSPPTLPPTVSPEGVKPVSTVKTTTAPTTVPIVTTEQITSAPSSTLEFTGISTVRTTLSPFPVSTLLTSSTSPTASKETLYTTSTTTSPPSTVMVQPMSSTEGPTLISTLPSVTVFPPRDTTKATTRLVDLSPISTTSSLRPTEVSDTLRDTVRTTLPIITTGVYNETSTKLVVTAETGKTPTTQSLPPGVTSTDATTEYSSSPPYPVHTVPLSTLEATSAHTTESTSPVIAFTTLKTTPFTGPTPTTLFSEVTTKKTVHTTPMELRTSTMPIPELPSSPSVDILLTTTSTIPTPPTSEQAVTTEETSSVSTAKTVPVPTTHITTTTAVVPPLKITDTTVPSRPTSQVYTERTSWSVSLPTTERTTQTTQYETTAVDWGKTTTTTSGPTTHTTLTVSPDIAHVTTKPPKILLPTEEFSPSTSTMSTSTEAMVTTSTTSLVSPVETTTVLLSPVTSSPITASPTTAKTTEPWRPPHRETSSTPIYSTEKVTTAEASPKPFTPLVISTTSSPIPPRPPSTSPSITMATSVATTTSILSMTTSKISTFPEPSSMVMSTSTIEKPTTPKPPDVLTTRLLETPSITVPTRPEPPSTLTTTFGPITFQPLKDTTPALPVTERVKVSTTATTSTPLTRPPLLYTTSTIVPRPTTHPERVTTRVISTTRTTMAPTTRISRVTTTRITSKVPVTTQVPPTSSKTERSTVRTTTDRVSLTTRSPGEPTSSITPGPPTAPPSDTSTTVSQVPITTARTSTKVVTTASTSEYDYTTTVPSTTSTTAATSVPVPSLTTVTASTAVPIGVTTKPSTPTQIHITSTESSKTPPHDNQTFTAGVTTTEVTPKGTTTSTILTLSSTATPSYTPEPEKVETTPAELSPSPAPESPSTTVKTTLAAEITTSMVVSSTRVCTPPYAEFIDECTKYICVTGQLVLFNKSQNCPYSSTPPNCGLLGFAILVNGDKCCPQWDCPCRCSVFPDLNVITFDGNSVAIYKAASYIVTQLPNETVSMLVQECPSSDSNTLLWNFTNLCLVALNITHQSNHVIINRLQRRLYVNSRYAKPRFKKLGFEILDTGNMYLIRTPAGLRLQWFHSTGMMVIETESYNNKLLTMGLCGCCDGNPANDLMLSNGTTVGESEDPGVFIDSWQVPNTTSYVSPSRRREVNCSTSDCSQCLSMLHNHSFMSCHAFVPPTTFCEMWVRDAEYVNNPCVALAAYVASCHKFNVCIEWRSPDYCPFICPEDLRYQACLPACTAQTCSNHDFDYDPEQCSGLTEGCVCPEGTLLHRPYSALCIPPEKCACTDSSGVPRGHGEVWKASKDGCCMYRCDNDSIVPVEYNCSTVPSPVCRRTGEMVISLADDTSCCPQKACICNQSLCEVFPPECKYGEKLVSYFREDSCCPEYVCECDPELCELDLPTCREDQTLIATKTDGSCCLAHICMCSACTEIIPECQDGEVLTVDANSTDRCCPIYHCVCEPYRCPDTTCPLGMSPVIVSSPNQCCPMHTCECACDKLLRPKCVMGETMQLDRAFQTDPVNQCACKRYKCVREAVCVDGERGVMRPGQTLVEHSQDGVCHTAQCTRGLDTTTGYHRIRTTSTNCSALCQMNQIYIPPKDQTTCCGVCKNISCLYQNENGTSALYKPGKSWVSNCVKYDCTDTLSGPTLVTYSYSCPPFNETECMKIGGTIVSYMDGCCKTCKEDGKSCQKVTVRMTIRKNDCRSNRPVNIVSCDGKCPSASIYNYNINTYARFCKCCREMGLQRRSVQLYCNGNSTWVSYSIQEPTDCSCQWS
ncbi:otogelin [Hypomesus transpacificus]|uniref:otogelin n=1 Tax=Hypomesus transpacificus TaxID=137520 RepID=UPI001F072E40|nr:otogelin [Hypomesus transpacificus]